MIEEDGNQANVGGARIEQTEMEDLEKIQSVSQPVLTQESLVRELLTSVPKVVHLALAQCLELMGDVLMVRTIKMTSLSEWKRNGLVC